MIRYTWDMFRNWLVHHGVCHILNPKFRCFPCHHSQPPRLASLRYMLPRLRYYLTTVRWNGKAGPYEQCSKRWLAYDDGDYTYYIYNIWLYTYNYTHIIPINQPVEWTEGVLSDCSCDLLSLAVNLADRWWDGSWNPRGTHGGHLIGYPQDWIGNTKAIARFLWSHDNLPSHG